MFGWSYFALLFAILQLIIPIFSFDCNLISKIQHRQNRYTKNSHDWIIKNKIFKKKPSFILYSNWWEDDLPNILGINPIEAAIIFGLLYYVYGPDTIYEYARQAGKLFSTYAPVVKDVSVDIFNEFKDYLEENRDRDILKKNGVDVDGIPRRTTNIIERFQQSLSVIRKLNIVMCMLFYRIS
jgi:hypothetical protein